MFSVHVGKAVQLVVPGNLITRCRLEYSIVSCRLLQHIKAIVQDDSLLLLDSDHPAIQEFTPELQVCCSNRINLCISLPRLHNVMQLSMFCEPSTIMYVLHNFRRDWQPWSTTPYHLN